VPFVMTQGAIDRVQPASSTLAMGMYSPYMQVGPEVYRSYEQMWKTQPALRTVIEFIARNIAQLGLDVFERTGETDRKKVRDHPLSELLNDPWPGSIWTKYRLINWTVQEYSIFNSAFWLKGKAPDGSNGVLPIPRRYIEPVGDNPFFPEKWRITGTKGYRDVDPEQLVHFYGYNPDNPSDGYSPIETLRAILAEEYAATVYREQMWRNGARISGYITRPEKAPRWSDTARNRFKADWGTYSNDMAAGGTPILEDGMSWHEGGITPKDAQYIEARELSREEVASAYHVDPSMIGLSKNTTQSSLGELRQMLYADAFGPMLEMLQQDIELQLLPDLDPSGAKKCYVEFNLRQKMQGSFEAQAAAVSASVGAPWMTRNEGRALYNLSDVPEGDELITPLNVTEGGLASPRDTAPDNPSNEESNGKPPKPKPVGSG
jgi:HK97 family phage portal protein